MAERGASAGFSPNDRRHFLQILDARCEAIKRMNNDLSLGANTHELDRCRRKTLRMFKKVANESDSGQLLTSLYRSCYYSLMNQLRAIHMGGYLTWDSVNWIKGFELRMSAELIKLRAEFPQHKVQLAMYCGDMNRYMYSFFNGDANRDLAEAYYKQAAYFDHDLGHAMNQLGDLLQGVDPAKTLVYLMLAQTAANPWPHAYESITAMLNPDNGLYSSGARTSTTIRLLMYAYHAQLSWGEAHELCTRWLEEIEALLASRDHFKIRTAVNRFITVSLALACVSKTAGKKGKVVVPFLSQLLVDADMLLLRTGEELSADAVESSVVMSQRRRRNASNSSGDSEKNAKGGNADEEEERDFEEEEFAAKFKRAVVKSESEIAEETHHSALLKSAKEVLVALVLSVAYNAPQIYDRMAPLASRKGFEEVCTLLVELLSTLVLGDFGEDAEKNFAAEDTEQYPMWYLLEENMRLLLPTVLKRMTDATDSPIKFEEYFRFLPTESRRDELMRAMAASRQEYCDKQEKARSNLPLTVVPELGVVMRKLNVLRNVVNARGFVTVAIPEDVLRNLDLLKKSEVKAREAIRWMQMEICNRGTHVTMLESKSVLECAKLVVKQTKNTNNQALVATILTLDSVHTKNDQPAMVGNMVSRENVDRFIQRYTEALKEC